MKNIKNAQWIKIPKIADYASVEFSKEFSVSKPVKKATMEATAYGVYNIILNGKKVGDYIFAPGWTSYHNRLQVETYDITDSLINNNTIIIGVGPGWKCPNFFNSSTNSSTSSVYNLLANSAPRTSLLISTFLCL